MSLSTEPLYNALCWNIACPGVESLLMGGTESGQNQYAITELISATDSRFVLNKLGEIWYFNRTAEDSIDQKDTEDLKILKTRLYVTSSKTLSLRVSEE